MSDRGKTGKLRIDAKAVAIRYEKPVEFTLSPVLKAQIAELLNLDDPDRGAWAYRAGFIARNYLTCEALAQRYLSVSDSRKELKRMGAALRGVLAKIDTLHPMQMITLSGMVPPLARDPSQKCSLIEILPAIDDLATAAETMHAGMKPRRGRPENDLLKFSIGALMLLFERMTGRRATVSLIEDGTWTPRSSSPEAKAISLIMKAAAPTMGEGTIATIIDEIGKQHRSKPLKAYESLLWMSGPEITVRPIKAKE